MKFELNQQQKQVQTISVRMVQSMSILQMGSQDLQEYMNTVVQENPTLEMIQPDPEAEGADPAYSNGIDWGRSHPYRTTLYGASQAPAQDFALDNYSTTLAEECTISRHLCTQLEGQHLPQMLHQATTYLIACLDERGWLTEDVTELAHTMGASPALFESALTLIQSLEPAGIGAKSLSDCLVLQLQRKSPHDPVAIAIIESHLEHLSKHHYGAIARALAVDIQVVRKACDTIRALNPRPAQGFAAAEPLIYIKPDLLVVDIDEELRIFSNDVYSPRLTINEYYASLYRSTAEQTVREYLSTHLRQANDIVHAVEYRCATLLRCAEQIVAVQADFFRLGVGHLHPLSLAQMADALEVHPSTISRTLRDKYLQCKHGIFPLQHFISRTPYKDDGDGATVSSDNILHHLAKLIEEENIAKPLSDQQLCQKLTQDGYPLARRTVTKYREKLKIPSAQIRRRAR